MSRPMSRHAAIEDVALDWLIRRDEPNWSDGDQSELDGWLEESMAHRVAYLRAEHGWAEADRIRSLGYWNDQAGERPHAMRSWWPAAIAASLIAAVGIGTYSLQTGPSQAPRIQEARYDTPVGGRRTVPLADGSKVELNTRTVMRTAVAKDRREVWLDAGEAYFEVAHIEGEPFVVHAGTKTITVLGTKFSVRRDRDRVTVNVLEGRVRVDDGEGVETRAAIITAGDTAISRGSSTLIAAKSEQRVESALAWRDGILSFDQAPLTEVIAEFNRYNRTQLVVTDEAAARIPIGGSFQASSAESFVRLLHDAYGLRIARNDNSVKISSP